MHTFTETAPAGTPGTFLRDFLTPEMLLVDIETTGLSPARDTIYCIGTAYLTGDAAADSGSGKTVAITLFFSDTPEEEPALLEALLELLKTHDTLITFNGSTFDLPFIKKRLDFHALAHSLNSAASLDLYRETRKLKGLLRLSSYRQSAIEQFLGCVRLDRYSGGELIRVYRQYTVDPTPEALELLRLHNFEDVKGMLDLIELLSYREFLDGGFQIASVGLEAALENKPISEATYTQSIEHASESERETDSLSVLLIPQHPFPRSLSLVAEHFSLRLDSKKALLLLPVHRGVLRRYFPDYRNYYYLPEEKTVIHKSIGIYVDPQHRQKATRENCYVQKECAYLEGPTSSEGSYLKKELRDRHRYYDLTDLLNPNGYDPTSDEELYSFIQNLLIKSINPRRLTTDRCSGQKHICRSGCRPEQLQ